MGSGAGSLLSARSVTASRVCQSAAVLSSSLCFLWVMPLRTPFTVVVVGVRESENRCKRSARHLYPGITPAFPTFSKALRKQPLLPAAAPRAAPLPAPHLMNAPLGWCPQRSSAAHSSSCPHITLQLSQATGEPLPPQDPWQMTLLVQLISLPGRNSHS